MTRRMALASAGAITIVLLAAAAAIAANLGVLRVATDTTAPGGLTATDLAPAVTTQQPAGDRQTTWTDENRSGVEGREPGDDRSSGVEPGDHRPGEDQQADERYQGREDDD